jgi:hypothetical protein
MNNLPDDMLWEIYTRLHRLYMLDLQIEIYEKAVDFWEEYEDDQDSDYSASSDDETNSEYSYVDSE